ncbi:MAG: Holliday junction branch migration protein RuvA [Rickettsiales bacterium]
MIGKLTGIVDTLAESSLILDVGGVGYIVNCTGKLVGALQIGQKLSLLTQMVVKEDQLTLYGFSSLDEKYWFEMLQTVQGVGPKMALAVVNIMNPQDIINSIISEDEASFKRVSGIGGKVAARIVNELKSKKDLQLVANIPLTKATKLLSSVKDDALSALTNLGFSRKDAFQIIQNLHADNENLSLEDTIRLSLAKINS